MNKIISTTNQKIKDYSKLNLKKHRDSSKYFIVEGYKSYEEINQSGITIVDIFVLEKDINKYVFNNQITICNEAVMKKLSSTQSPPSVVTVAVKPSQDVSALKNAKNIALLENVKDAGNLGTIIRSAAAFGIDGIILLGDTVDIYNQKVIRSAAGNFFKLPILTLYSIDELKHNFSDFTLVSTALNNKRSYVFKPQQEKRIFMFGAEAEGISTELSKIADYNYVIPMNSNVESLNLSVAASIVFYECFKSNS